MRPLVGIGLKLISVVIFICMSVMIKMAAENVPPGQLVFFRSFFAIPVILAWLYMRGELSQGMGSQQPWGHFWRGFVGTAAMGCSFAGLGYLPLPEVTALGYACPLLMVVLAAVFLKEKVGVYRISAVVLGMVGVLIVLSPRLSIGAEAGRTEAFGAAIVLFGALCAAFAQITVRKLVATERTATIVFWFSVMSTVMSLMTLPFGWVIPSGRDLGLLISAGILGGTAQILLTASYREADASVVAPFEYASILFALTFGYLIFGDVPSWTMIGGASLVVAAGILIIWRERMLGIERAKQRKASSMNG